MQRVTSASVVVEGEICGAIGPGLVALIGVARDDGERDADTLLDKMIHLRIFADEQGKMNRSVKDTGGGLLLISQFTLYGDTRKGRRPSYDAAAPPEHARLLYEYFIRRAKQTGLDVQTGVFQAHMTVCLSNDGPVTVLLESRSS